MEPYIERLNKERDELNEKWVRLMHFKESKTFSELDGVRQGLLDVQARLMSLYATVLSHRIALEKGNSND